MTTDSASTIAIAGVPRSGKTTLAKTLARPIFHTDDLIQLPWSEASALAATWFDRPGPWVVEGVTVVRALRKWMVNNETGTPCDLVVWAGFPQVDVSDGQARMAKGCWTIWDGIRASLAERGVEIVPAADL